MTFSELGLSAEVLRGVEEAGYTEPTPIQRQSIPVVLQGRDVLGCAQTGTGKTASFALPIIDILAAGRARARMPRALILEPTRELADQVKDAFAVYAKYHKLATALLIGGVSMDQQSRQLERGADVLIATPGRLLDHVERGQVVLRGVQILVVDETDRMLDMGFIPDVQRIVRLLPKNRQTLFFSATLSPEIRSLGAEFVLDPKEITVAPPASPSETVRQGLLRVSPENKQEALRHLIEAEGVEHALVFLNRKRDVDVLARSLKRNGIAAAPIHGDLPQAVRMETLEKFKQGKIAFLIASDVAARGLDIEALPFVINFDVPSHAEDYIHRIGRTARAGRPGTAFTLAVPEDSKYLAAIHKLIGKPIPTITLDEVETPAKEAEPGRAERGRAEPRRRRGKGGTQRQNRGSKDREAKNGGAARPRHAKQAKPPQSKSPAPQAKPETKEQQPKGRTKAPRAKKESGGAMGGHVPAFLLRHPARR